MGFAMKIGVVSAFVQALLLVGLVRAQPVSRYMIAPFLDIPLMSTSQLHDLFENCPRYSVQSPRQLASPGDWTE